MSRRQGIFWLFTVPYANCATLALLEQGELPASIVWCKGQLERGASDYLHWQFVVAFRKKTSMATIRSQLGGSLPGFHAELSRSEAANDYVAKEDTRVRGPFEHGAKPIRRNSRTDWDSVWASAVSGNYLEIPANIRTVSYRTIRAIGADHMAPQPILREVYVFWGRTQSGKSRRAWEEAGVAAYSKCPRSKFWDGYQDQQHVVVDEFRGGIDVAHLLRWCDRYPVRIEIKGSSRPLAATKLWFTSNVDPRLWYPDLDTETLDALIRRFNIIHFN